MTDSNRSISQSLSTWAAFSSVVAVSACVGGAPGEPSEPAASAESSLSTEPTKFVLAIDGLDKTSVSAGWIMSVEGGGATSDVVTEKLGDNYFVKKHIGNVKYEDIKVTIPAPVSAGVAAWIADFLAGHSPRRSGSVKACNFDMSDCDELDFAAALITEIGFPACDGGSKDAAFLSLKFAPEITRYKKADGGGDAGAPVAQQAWAPAACQLAIAGVDTSKISTIDAISVKQPVTTAGVPGKLEFPNLKITLSEEYAAAFQSAFVINGNNDESKHKTGALTYLDQATTKELVTLNFENLGIFKVSSEPASNNGDTIVRTDVEMYTENVTAKFP